MNETRPGALAIRSQNAAPVNEIRKAKSFEMILPCRRIIGEIADPAADACFPQRKILRADIWRHGFGICERNKNAKSGKGKRNREIETSLILCNFGLLCFLHFLFRN